MPVYTKSELDNQLSKSNLKIPTDFYQYLTNISNKLVVYFDKDDIPLFYDNNECHPNKQIHLQSFICHTRKVFIPANITLFASMTDDILLQNRCYGEMPVRQMDFRMWMIFVGESWRVGHCYDYFIYLGEGPHFGSIWVNHSQSFDVFHFIFVKAFQTFSGYLSAVNTFKKGDITDFDDYLDFMDDELMDDDKGEE